MTLHSGLITQAIVAAYDYEGGDCKYIVTYGDNMELIENYAKINGIKMIY